MAVAKGVAKDVLYLNAWWRGNLAVAWAVAADSDMALSLEKQGFYLIWLLASRRHQYSSASETDFACVSVMLAG